MVRFNLIAEKVFKLLMYEWEKVKQCDRWSSVYPPDMETSMFKFFSHALDHIIPTDTKLRD